MSDDDVMLAKGDGSWMLISGFLDQAEVLTRIGPSHLIGLLTVRQIVSIDLIGRYVLLGDTDDDFCPFFWNLSFVSTNYCSR
jgi:hypothetical protein